MPMALKGLICVPQCSTHSHVLMITFYYHHYIMGKVATIKIIGLNKWMKTAGAAGTKILYCSMINHDIRLSGCQVITFLYI